MRRNKKWSCLALILSAAVFCTSVDVHALEGDLSDDIVLYEEEILVDGAKNPIINEDEEVLQEGTPAVAIDESEEALVREVAISVNLGNGAADAEHVASAFKDYVNAVNATVFSSSEASLLSVAGLFTRGLPAAGLICSGTISILEATGVIKSPMAEGFSAIQDGIKDLDSKMDRLEDEVKNVSEEIKKTSKIEREQRRQEGAAQYLDRWNKFNTDYVDKMEGMTRMLQSYLVDGIKNWWIKSEKDSISVIYAYPADVKEVTLAYSKEAYSGTIANKSQANEDVLGDYSFIFPKECIPDTASLTFNVDTYFSQFCDGFGKEAVKSALNNHQVSANDAFYSKWDGLSDDDKDKKAKEYAGDILKTVIYQENCMVISEKNDAITDYITEYMEYCKNIQAKQSGVDAFIQNLYLTHGFEGQVKDDINNFCNTQIKNVGTYGLLLMTAVNQSDKITLEQQQEIQTTWADTIEVLEAKKKNSLTGFDDFCYLTGTRISYESGAVGSTYGVNLKDEDTYDSVLDYGYKLGASHNSDGSLSGDLSRDDMCSEQDIQVLYDQFLQNPNGASDFLTYLGDAGIGGIAYVYLNDDSNIVTDIAKSPVPFDLTKGFKMDGVAMIDDDYVSSGFSAYVVNKINHLEDKYFVIHDELKCNMIDLKNVATGCSDDEILLARAVYGETHKGWIRDEGNVFEWGGRAGYYGYGSGHKSAFVNLYRDINYLQRTNVAELSRLGIGTTYYSSDSASNDANVGEGNTLDESSPLVVFNAPYILEKESNDETIPYSKADWSTLKWDNLKLIVEDHYIEGDGKNIDDYIDSEIDTAVANAKSNGINVSLSDSERKALSSRMIDAIKDMEDELKTNNSTDNINVLRIDGDDALEKDLATKTLPDIYFVDGECIIPPENMTVVAEYEPHAFIRFKNENGKVVSVVNPGYEIVPTLVVWDSRIEAFEGYQIPENVYRAHNLTMDVNIPTGMLANNDSIGVTCYYSIDNPSQSSDNKLAVCGTGEQRYVTLQVKNNMLYELRTDENGNKKSDSKIDSKQILEWLKMVQRRESEKEDTSEKGNNSEQEVAKNNSNNKASVVNPLVYKYDSDINVSVAKQEQGLLCKSAFALGRPSGYQEAFSVNVLVGGKATYDNKKGQLVIYIPMEYRKTGRKFAIVGVDNMGLPTTYYDEDTNDATITVSLNIKGYALDLVYSDK